jgi:WD40 repeat protein
VIKEIAAHSDGVTGVAFREGFELLSTGHDGNLRTWDLRKYKCTTDLPVHVRKYDEGALCLAVGAEGQVAVGGADGCVKWLQGE